MNECQGSWGHYTFVNSMPLSYKMSTIRIVLCTYCWFSLRQARDSVVAYFPQQMRLFSDVRSSCGRTSKAFGVFCFVLYVFRIVQKNGRLSGRLDIEAGNQVTQGIRNEYFWWSCRVPVSHNTHTNNTRARTLLHFAQKTDKTSSNGTNGQESTFLWDFSSRRSRQLENPHTVNALTRNSMTFPVNCTFSSSISSWRHGPIFEGGTITEKNSFRLWPLWPDRGSFKSAHTNT